MCITCASLEQKEAHYPKLSWFILTNNNLHCLASPLSVQHDDSTQYLTEENTKSMFWNEDCLLWMNVYKIKRREDLQVLEACSLGFEFLVIQWKDIRNISSG